MGARDRITLVVLLGLACSGCAYGARVGGSVHGHTRGAVAPAAVVEVGGGLATSAESAVHLVTAHLSPGVDLVTGRMHLRGGAGMQYVRTKAPWGFRLGAIGAAVVDEKRGGVLLAASAGLLNRLGSSYADKTTSTGSLSIDAILGATIPVGNDPLPAGAVLELGLSYQHDWLKSFDLAFR